MFFFSFHFLLPFYSQNSIKKNLLDVNHIFTKNISTMNEMGFSHSFIFNPTYLIRKTNISTSGDFFCNILLLKSFVLLMKHIRPNVKKKNYQNKNQKRIFLLSFILIKTMNPEHPPNIISIFISYLSLSHLLVVFTLIPVDG